MKTRSLIALLLLAVLACNRVESPTAPTPAAPAPPSTPAAAPTIDRIEYRVQGSSILLPVTIRHLDPLDGLTLTSSSLPYVATATNTDPSAFLYLEASAFGFSTSTLQVQIFVNGHIFREGSSVGSVLFAHASGTFRR